DHAEDQRSDGHLDQPDEAVAQRAEGLTDGRPEVPDQHTGDDGDDDLEEQGAVEPLPGPGAERGSVRRFVGHGRAFLRTTGGVSPFGKLFPYGETSVRRNRNMAHIRAARALDFSCFHTIAPPLPVRTPAVTLRAALRHARSPGPRGAEAPTAPTHRGRRIGRTAATASPPRSPEHPGPSSLRPLRHTGPVRRAAPRTPPGTAPERVPPRTAPRPRRTAGEGSALRRSLPVTTPVTAFTAESGEYGIRHTKHSAERARNPRSPWAGRAGLPPRSVRGRPPLRAPAAPRIGGAGRAVQPVRTGSSSGRFAVRPSPEERPRTRRAIHGPRKSAAPRSSAAVRRSGPAGASGGSGSAQDPSAPGRPRASAAAAAIRACPSGEACSRSALHSRGSVTTGCSAVSTRSAPCRRAEAA